MGVAGRADRSGETIVALATAPGRGALAVVRLSGSNALGLAARLATPWPPAPRVATRVSLHRLNAPQQRLDDALATIFPGPRSFTGDDVVEFSLHGGHYVSTIVLAELVEAGARVALPGEFTERAVRAGKMDLLQAEAINDLIEARSSAMHRAAMQQLSGALSGRLAALRRAVLEVEALIAYELDFPEEDDGPQPHARALEAAARLVAECRALEGTLPASILGREGVTVVIAGAPNAGKSSLLNALAGEARAIVSEIPGTTRDAIELLLDFEPWPLRLVDTAGLRASDDPVERLGIEVSQRHLGGASLVLVCGESAESLTHAADAVAALTTAPQIWVGTKADLGESNGDLSRSNGDRAVAVSAMTGAGLDALREAIRAALVTLQPAPSEEQPIVTRARHAAAIVRARVELESFAELWSDESVPAPVAATHLRAAVHELDELLGGLDVDDILAELFRTFCVGK